MEQCPLCFEQDQLMEEHHLYPIALGGKKEGPTINICTNCHRGVHFTADAKFSRNKNTRNKQYLSDETLERASKVIQIIVTAKEKYNSGNTNRHVKRRKMVTLSVTDDEWLRFRKFTRDRNMSTTKFLEQVVENASKTDTL